MTFRENVAIALAVAELAGVDRERALAGMWAAAPDPGALTTSAYRVGDALVRVANLFAANDPESTMINLRALLGQGAIDHPLHLVVNSRPDRLERNAQMGALVPEIDPERVVLIGEPVRSARQAIPRDWPGRVDDAGGRLAPDELLRRVLDDPADTVSLVLVGNIHGQGEVLLERLAALPCLDEVTT